jgi:hypothetical protein
MILLGVKESTDENLKKPDKRMEVLDQICKTHDWSPRRLLTMPLDEVGRYYAEFSGTTVTNTSVLPILLGMYLRANGITA